MVNQFVLLEAPACAVCQERAATKSGRCLRCYEYWRRRGVERPVWLRPQARYQACVVCQQRPVAQSGRCGRCYSYLQKNGRERPLTTVPRGKNSGGRLCINGCPTEAWANGRCVACYQWHRRHGDERPPPYSGPLGAENCTKDQ